MAKTSKAKGVPVSVCAKFVHLLTHSQHWCSVGGNVESLIEEFK